LTGGLCTGALWEMLLKKALSYLKNTEMKKIKTSSSGKRDYTASLSEKETSKDFPKKELKNNNKSKYSVLPVLYVSSSSS
jgi:hypothetical protein